jgi:DNA polymerase-3 subunit delta'
MTNNPVDLANQAFKPLKGQSGAIELLTQAVSQNRVAPAYLFVGVSGIGKSLAARCFLELLLTVNLPREQHAIVYQRLKQGNHPDVLWVEPSYLHQGKLLTSQEAAELGVKKKTPPQIRIEQVRQISQFLAKPPMLSEQSLVVIDQSQTMAEGAANALLKTLEEPGKATLILIAPSVDSLLPTLVSRCQKIPFFPLPQDLMIEVLNGVDRSLMENHESVLENILGIAQGSPGKAIELTDQLTNIPMELLNRLIKLPHRAIDALNIAKEIDRELDGMAQLFLLDYLQYNYWHHHHNPNLIRRLERSRKYLLNYVQPRLVWECLMLGLSKEY